jgi:hypothetical protein
MNTIKKQATVNKLPAAPASFSVSAVTSGVVGEPDDAGFGRLTVGLCYFPFMFFFDYHCEERSNLFAIQSRRIERRVLFERPCGN